MENEFVNYLPDNLRFIRARLNITQEQMAARIGIKRTHYSNYENRLREPNFATLSKIFAYCQSVFDLDGASDLIFNNLEGKMNFDNSPLLRNIEECGVTIPVFDVISAEAPLKTVKDIVGSELIPKSWLEGGREYFAFKITDDIMEPKYLEGDVVIFQKVNDCESGSECIVIVNDNDATFKKVIKTDVGLILQPLNHKYEPEIYSIEEQKKSFIKIIGKVKEIRRK